MARHTSPRGPTPPTPRAAGPAPAVPSTVGVADLSGPGFMGQLRAGVTGVANERLAGVGRSADECPWIGHWLDHYEGQPPAHLLAVAHRYAPASRSAADSSELVAAVAARVGTSIDRWVAAGGALEATPAVGDGPRSAAPLPPAVRSTVEGATGVGLGDVRVYRDATAGRIADRIGAAAATQGRDVFVGPRARGPAEPLILAHEAAHAAQSRGRGGDAEGAADRVVAAGLLGRRAAPGAGGLALHGCDWLFGPSPTPTTTTAPSPPQPTPQQRLETTMQTVLADQQITPSEWATLNQVGGSLGVSAIQSAARSVSGVESDVASMIGLLAAGTDTASVALRGAYTGAFVPATAGLTPDPLPVLLRHALADHQLTFAELDALRRLNLASTTFSDWAALQAALLAANVSRATVDGLMRVVRLGAFAWNSLSAETVHLPITLTAAASGTLSTSADLRVLLLRALMGKGSWDTRDFPVVRGLLQPLGHTAATALLTAAGITDASQADELARQFTLSSSEYALRVTSDIEFQRSGSNFTVVTARSVSPAAVPVTGAAQITSVPGATSTNLPSYTFPSGVTEPAYRTEVSVGGVHVPIVMPQNLIIALAVYRSLDHGIRAVPVAHRSLIRSIVYDPGGAALFAAHATPTGEVAFYPSGLSGTGEAQRIMVHEVGHLVSFDAASRSRTFWSDWNAAIAADRKAVSVYGLSTNREDFAETYLLYVRGGSCAANRRSYTRRYEILDTFMPRGIGCWQAPPAPPTPAPSGSGSPPP